MDIRQDEDRSQRWGRWAWRLAVVNAYLLAAFWPVHSFFAWLFIGLTSYFAFAAWYFRRPQEPRREAEPQWWRPGQPSPPNRRSQLVYIITTLAGIVLVIVVVRSLVASVSSTESDVTTEQTQDSTYRDDSQEHPSQNEDALIDEGNKLFNANDFDGAMERYERVLRINPRNQFALYNKALVFYNQKDYNSSMRVLRHAMEVQPDYVELRWLLAQNYQARQQNDSSTFWYQNVYSSGLRDGNFLIDMATFYESSDRAFATRLYKEALQSDSSLSQGYKRLIELDPDQADRYRQMLNKWSSN